MQAIDINYLAVVVAAVVQMVLGYLWYGPLFGKKWMALMDIDPNNMGDKSGMGKRYALMFIGSLIMSWVLVYAITYAGLTIGTIGVTLGLLIGLMNWLGFIAPVTLGSVLWENKSWKLWWLNNGYYIVSLLLMGAILAAWR
ncbi:DUF1761 domain-containing protein [Candidatus Parcubacteria bacterium]|nr:DUF1761 domain-containing protein [Candidatus Parcubacteria bacterium]